MKIPVNDNGAKLMCMAIRKKELIVSFSKGKNSHTHATKK
jgi:hypothetical protein